MSVTLESLDIIILHARAIFTKTVKAKGQEPERDMADELSLISSLFLGPLPQGNERRPEPPSFLRRRPES